MNETSRMLREAESGSIRSLDGIQGSRWIQNLLFALTFGFAVILSASVVYPGTRISIAWLAGGIAVWWAVTCRSRAAFLWICSAVFVISVIGLTIVGKPYWSVLLLSVSNVIAGPLVAPLMALLERRRPTGRRRGEDGRIAPLARIESPRHIYRLLLSVLFTVAIAKLFTLLSLNLNHADTSVTLYLSLILRDLAGTIAIAGPGIAVFTARSRLISDMAVREFMVVSAVTAVLLAVVFWPGQDLPLVYLAMLPLYWSATRLPVVLASLHTVVTVAGTVALTLLVGAGPFGMDARDSIQQSSAVQLFVIVCVLLSLVVSTTVQQHSALVKEYEAAAATIPDALLLVGRDGRVMPVNESAKDLVTEDAEGRYVLRGLRRVDGRLLDEWEMPDVRALQGEEVRGSKLVELDQPEDNGSERIYYSVRASPLIREGEIEPSHAILLYHDSTDEYENMKKLQVAHDEARHLFEFAPQGIVTLNDEGVIQEANQAFGDLVGAAPSALVGHTLDEFDREAGVDQAVRDVVNQPGRLVQVDRCFNTIGGESKRVALSLRTLGTEGSGEAKLLVNAVDVTERQRLHELVSQLADQDDLTGLFNRRRFEAELAGILERNAAEDTDGALLLLDLDYFKLVNDIHGHKQGDDVLVEISHLLKESVRAGDIVGRLGGDEFIIALPNADRDAAETVGIRIIESVRKHFEGRSGAVGRLTASIGIAMFSEARNQDVDPYILADQLLYAAKYSGRNQLATVGSPGGSEPDVDESIDARVEQILEEEAVRLEIQPIAEAVTGRVVGGEALVRVAEDQDPIPPGELVGAIERAGLGRKLDVCVIRKAIALLPELRRASPEFRLSVNVSAQSFASTETANVVLDELDRQGVDPASLVLELTETAPVEDFEAARQAQQLLRNRGVAMALDDFGIGNDHYRCVKELNFDILKIAGEFVRNMADNESDATIVKSMVYLANEEGMETVAEFVSDEPVCEAAREAGVSYLQGYHIGKSLPPGDFISIHLSQTGVA